MPRQIILDVAGPLGPAGTLVWVDDPSDVEDKPKKTAAPSASGRKSTAPSRAKKG